MSLKNPSVAQYSVPSWYVNNLTPPVEGRTTDWLKSITLQLVGAYVSPIMKDTSEYPTKESPASLFSFPNWINGWS